MRCAVCVVCAFAGRSACLRKAPPPTFASALLPSASIFALLPAALLPLLDTAALLDSPRSRGVTHRRPRNQSNMATAATSALENAAAMTGSEAAAQRASESEAPAADGRSELAGWSTKLAFSTEENGAEQLLDEHGTRRS